MKREMILGLVVLLAVVIIILIINNPDNSHPVTNAAASEPAPGPAPVPTPSQWQQWRTNVSVSDMDGSKTAMLIMDSAKDGANHSSSIVIRCGRKLEAYISLGAMAGGRDYETSLYKVRVRFDDHKPQAQHWPASTDYEGLFSPEPRSFIRQLESSKEFRFEYTPYQSVPDVATFQLGGLKEELAKQPSCRL